MADEIRRFDYRHAIVDDDTGLTARILEQLEASGVQLLAFSAFPHGVGKSQLVLMTHNGAALEHAAEELGLRLTGKKSGYLVRGEDREGAAAQILRVLAGSGVQVTSMQFIPSGEGRFGALLWTKEDDTDRVKAALVGADLPDTVDEASQESFPASDAPAWAT